MAPQKQDIPVDEGLYLAYAFIGQAVVVRVATGAVNDAGFDVGVS
jgi:hypothetical protein